MKSSVSDLALFGGRAAFAEPLHVGRPTLGDRGRLLERINGVLDRRWFTNNGPLVQEFEQRLAEQLDVPHVIACCNGTLALELAIRACGFSGEVIVPAFTFVASAHALQWQGIRPVFCDIDARTRTLDPRRVAEAITPRTAGIIGVHLWGRACDIEGLSDVASRHGLPLIFDAAHAFGCTYGGHPIGGFGRAEVFSFHATKCMSTFEGGAVATRDDDLARRIRLMKNFGFSGYDEVVYIGTNGKMSEISAAMGLTSLESFEVFVNANRRNAERYAAALAGVPGIALVDPDPRERTNYQYVIVDIDAARYGLDRDTLQQVLWAENVLARRYFYPGCHRMEPYRSMTPPESWTLPVTEDLSRRVLALPTGPSVSAEDIATVSGLVQFACVHAPAIAGRLAPAVGGQRA